MADSERPTTSPEPSKTDLARGISARVLPRMPEKLGHSERRLIRSRPVTHVRYSYLRQRYWIDLDGERSLLGPVRRNPGADGAGGGSVAGEARHVIGSWHPGGSASTFAQCQEHHAALCERLLARGLEVAEAVAAAADSSWFEAVLLVTGLTDEDAVVAAWEAGQAAAVRWDAAELTVLPTGLVPEVGQSHSAWTLRPALVRTCPVRSDDDATGRCQPYGGPFGSAAIHAAALWQAHRKIGLRLLGCDPCADGHEPTWGPYGRARGAFSISDEIVGSRYGSYGWTA